MFCAEKQVATLAYHTGKKLCQLFQLTSYTR